MPQFDGTAHALVVGESEARRRRLGHLLMLHGWIVRWEAGLSVAIERARCELTHLVLLDWDPTQKAAFDSIRRMRNETLVPLVVVGNRATEDDAVRAIELGAEDFLCEPLHRRLFQLRCTAVGKRRDTRRAVDHDRIGHDSQCSKTSTLRHFGPLTIDVAARRVTVDGTLIDLTPAEFSILLRLASTPGVPISDRELVTEALHEAFRSDSSIARFHIHHLRKKLCGHNYLIESVRPRAYRLSARIAPA